MISEKLQKAINDQITAEMWSSNLYLSMSFYLKKEGFDGCTLDEATVSGRAATRL